MEKIQKEISELENQLKDTEIVHATEKQKVVAIEETVEKVEARLEKLKQEEKEIETRVDENRTNQEQLENRKLEIDEEIAN